MYIHRLQLANPTGVHRYATEIAAAVAAESTDLSIELCSGRVRERAAVSDLGVRLSYPRAPRRPLHLSWTVLERPAIERVVGDLDLLHVLLPVFPIRSRAPQILTIHDLLPILHPEWYARFPRFAFRRTMAARDHLTAIITPSHQVADDLQQTLGVDPAKIRVIPEGVNERFSQPVDPDAAARTVDSVGVGARPFILTVGAVSPRKNLRVVFDALSILAKGDDGAPEIVVVGADDLGAEQTRAAAAASGVDHLIRFTGRLSDDELCHLLSRARALVHPSLYEGFGLTPLEAMAAGTPVVGSNAGALPEVIADAGLMVDPHDATMWAAVLRSVLSDDALRARLIAAGRDRASELTWERAGRETLDLYRQILNR